MTLGLQNLFSMLAPNIQSVATDIIAIITEWVTGFVTLIITVFNAFIELFYASPDGIAPEEITFIGVLALMSIGVGVVYLGLGWMKRLFS